MKTQDLHQTVKFAVPPATVYRALMNSRLHSRITASKAEIGARAGSPFSVWDGAIHGITLALAPNRRIVQAWRSKDWPVHHHSIADFTFEPDGRGTRLVFAHCGIPVSDFKGVTVGWRVFYWNPMKELFEAAK
jgi:activator of HSP90 ATPase